MPLDAGTLPISIERVGWQEAAACRLVNRSPSAARASRLGVGISLPKAPMSVKPRSSAIINKTFGRLSPAGAAVSVSTDTCSDSEQPIMAANNITQIENLICAICSPSLLSFSPYRSVAVGALVRRHYTRREIKSEFGLSSEVGLSLLIQFDITGVFGENPPTSIESYSCRKILTL